MRHLRMGSRRGASDYALRTTTDKSLCELRPHTSLFELWRGRHPPSLFELWRAKEGAGFAL